MPRKRPTSRRRPRSTDWVSLAWEATVELAAERKQELVGFLYALLSLALLLALLPKSDNLLGLVGGQLFRVFFGAFGFAAYLVPAGLAYAGFSAMLKRQVHAPSVKAAGWSLGGLAVVCLVNLAFPEKVKSGIAEGLYLGGLLGHFAGLALHKYLATAGTVAACLAMLGISVYLLEQEGLVKMVFLRAYERARIAYQGWRVSRGAGASDEEVASVEEALAPRPRRRSTSPQPPSASEDALDAPPSPPRSGEGRGDPPPAPEALVGGEERSPLKLASAAEREAAADAFLRRRQQIKVSAGGPRVNTLASTDAIGEKEGVQPRTDLADYKLPSVDLLKTGSAGLSAPKDYEEISANLERVLTSFGVAAKVVEVCPGPTVTRYEIALAPGVKMSRVVTLADDIALGAKVSSVRIEGPIPGKGTLGIEIPNAKAVSVFMRELVETEEFSKSSHKLIFAVGKDIGGSMIFSNLAEMPHLMVAGATGSGKSVCLNAIITSLLFRAAPDEVKLLLIDPKRVELTPYDGVPHLMRPVVANPKEAAGALRLMVEEMEERYKKLASAGMRKIDDYNEWVAQAEAERERSPEMEGEELEQVEKQEPLRRLPYIVVVVDELADLMMVSANEVESSICRLAQMARGVGIHLVIATQRPSVDVITGVIKANLPSRIAFQVSSKIDSRTILDGSGAEALLGKGDMLYSPYNVSKPVRVQGCFLSPGEVSKVVAHVKAQADPVFDERFTALSAGSEEGPSERLAGEDFSDVDDKLYEEALRIVIQAGQGSTSVLQRRLGLGFGRASRLLDRMEAEGIIGPAQHNKPRKLLIDPSQYSDADPEAAPAAE